MFYSTYVYYIEMTIFFTVLATQQVKASPEPNKPHQQNSEGQSSSQGQTFTPTKYSPSDIEMKKQDALRRKPSKVTQQLNFDKVSNNNWTGKIPSPSKGQSSGESHLSSPVLHNSKDEKSSPTKYSPSDIERKRQEAIKRRQLSSSQELKGHGHSPNKVQPLSQGHPSFEDDLEKCFDNSQGSITSPSKYSQSDIERKRQEAVKRRLLSSSQELKGQDHSLNKQPSLEHHFSQDGPDQEFHNDQNKKLNPTKHFQDVMKRQQLSSDQKVKEQGPPNKDLALCQVQTSSQRNSSTSANSSQGQVSSSPIKYSQSDIERKKQEALKRRKLKANVVQSKGK